MGFAKASNPEYASTYCLSGLYAPKLFVKGYGMSPDATKITVVSKINDMSPGKSQRDVKDKKSSFSVLGIHNQSRTFRAYQNNSRKSNSYSFQVYTGKRRASKSNLSSFSFFSKTKSELFKVFMNKKGSEIPSMSYFAHILWFKVECSVQK